LQVNDKVECHGNLEIAYNEPQFPAALIRTACFYSPPLDGSEPKYITLDMKKDGTRNYPHHEVDIAIRDIRGRETDFTLNIHGFQALADRDVDLDFSNEEEIKAVYVLKIKELLLKHVEGSRKIVVFDTTIRRASTSEVLHRPVRKVHIDQSARGAHLRARHSLSADEIKTIEAGELRFRIVNVWKAIDQSVTDHPLMFADSTTVEDVDLVAVEQRYPHYSGETYAVRHNKAQKFWFWSDMSTSDLVLLQCFDSLGQLDGQGFKRRTRCAHGSFNLYGSEEETFTRSSMELRCLILG